MKKLLILGANYTEIEIIKRAKSLGYYTIVTDNHLDWDLAPAKSVADEAWDISWSDLDQLEIKSKIENVQGVIAGFSEFRVENMIKLCARLNLPCYLNLDQLETTRDKVKFKDLCRRNNVPCVPEYIYGQDVHFPVIIKPVDRAGSIGINIATNQDELEKFYNYALSLSPSKNVIIEDYINDGMKFDALYFVKNGNITLLGLCDTIMCEGKTASPILQMAWTFPSTIQSLYLEKVDQNVRNMIRDLGMQNGYADLSAFYRNGNVYFFEAGFRLSGGMPFNYYQSLSGINYLDLMLQYAMNDDTQHIAAVPELLDKKYYCVTLNFYGKDGTISKINKPLRSHCKEIIADILYVKEGDSVKNSTSVLSKIAMYTLFASNIEDLLSSIKYVNEHLSILDDANREMIYEYLDINRLSF